MEGGGGGGGGGFTHVQPPLYEHDQYPPAGALVPRTTACISFIDNLRIINLQVALMNTFCTRYRKHDLPTC